MTEAFRKVLRVIWYLVSPLLLYSVVSEMTAIAWQAFHGELREEEVLLVSTLAAGVASPMLLYWYRQVRLKNCSRTGRKAFAGIICIARIIGMAIGACLFANHLLILLGVPSEGYEAVEQVLYKPAFAVQVVGTGLLIPFAEELVFRGLGYDRLRAEVPYGEAVLISSVFFGLYHGNLIQGIYALILGLLITIIYETYDSILAAWLFHAAANLTSVLLTASSLEQWLDSSTGWRVALVAVGGLLVVGSFCKMRKEIK